MGVVIYRAGISSHSQGGFESASCGAGRQAAGYQLGFNDLKTIEAAAHPDFANALEFEKSSMPSPALQAPASLWISDRNSQPLPHTFFLFGAGRAG